jgi:glutamate synthase domain-containing protein 3
MIKADANLHFTKINEAVRDSKDTEIIIEGCCGQRYIGAGLKGKKITINGTPGNALGAYLDGSDIIVNGNAQDATGDTMNEGNIIINGSSGDATGYAMRGGKIFVKNNVGYRAGIHMKAYKEKQPKLVIGGRAGSFLGEYQAGGIIIVLGNHTDNKPIIGNFCGTGMHGGRIYLRCDEIPTKLPKQVKANVCTKEDLKEIDTVICEFCNQFGLDKKEILSKKFFLLTPDSANPYTQMYTHN